MIFLKEDEKAYWIETEDGEIPFGKSGTQLRSSNWLIFVSLRDNGGRYHMSPIYKDCMLAKKDCRKAFDNAGFFIVFCSHVHDNRWIYFRGQFDEEDNMILEPVETDNEWYWMEVLKY